MSGSSVSYRDRIYIVKDVIIKLVEYGELTQTSLVSYCGLNLKKHKGIIDELESNDLITRDEMTQGKRTIAIYKPTYKGIEFCRSILEPYEKMFPRTKTVHAGTDNSNRDQKVDDDSSSSGINKKGPSLLTMIFI
jgi:predicted transcriptional regulator